MIETYPYGIMGAGALSDNVSDAARATISRDALSAGTAATPTVAQFLDAANEEYLLGGTPPGMTPFMVDGSQLSCTNALDGMSAKAWITDQNQVVIAYQGTTGGLNILTDPLAAFSQVITDIGIYAQTVTPAEQDALSFAQTVTNDAAARGISSSNVFVTGHSLGGIEAEYVAQQTGLGGVGFEPTGIPASSHAGSGSNFVDIVTYGDPVGNYSSDIRGEQNFAPSSGLSHYGQIVMIGNPADQTTLHNDVAGWGNIFLDPVVLFDLAGLLADYHLPGVQAHDLGVNLSPYNIIVDGLGNQTGPVWSVGNDTIGQLLAANAHR